MAETAATDDWEDTAGEPDAEPSSSPGGSERSEIRFPYSDLKDAEEVAVAVWTNFGTTGTTLRELAPHMNTTDTSSGFKQKVAAAKTFGVLASTRNRAELTPLGVRLADETTAADARVACFLQVPLYEAIYRQYEGRSLPGDTGLEADMKGLGVTPKSVTKARQVFQRSAERAGFFRLGANRLVKPTGTTLDHKGDDEKPPLEKPKKPEVGVYEGIATHPILIGLWKMVPSPDEAKTWPKAKRDQWLNAVKVNLDLLYDDEADSLPNRLHPS